MGLRINANAASMNAQYQLRKNNAAVSKAMEKISSGNRITKAGDDVAGLAISDTLRANIRGLKQVERNAQDGISMIQVADGNLAQIGNILIRLRELGVQAASDTISDRERAFVGHEYNQMLEEIDRLANSAEFNGAKLLNGSGQRMDFQINTGNSDIADRISFDPSQADCGTTALGIERTSVNDKISAQECLGAIDQAISSVSDLRANFGSIQSRLVATTENIANSLENVSAANSRIRDADIAEETSELSKKNMMLQAGTSILAQANQQPGQALSLLNRG